MQNQTIQMQKERRRALNKSLTGRPPRQSIFNKIFRKQKTKEISHGYRKTRSHSNVSKSVNGGCVNGG